MNLITALEDYFQGYNRIKKVITLPNNKVDRQTALDIVSQVYYDYHSNFSDYYRTSRISEVLDEIGLEWYAHSGRFIARLMRSLPEFSNYAGRIGEEITRKAYAPLGQKFFLSISSEIFWHDGNFGKEDSCWWGSYEESRQVFTECANGIALLFHRNDQDAYNGIGRLWIAPIKSYLFCFNQYGENNGIPIRIESTARILTQIIPNTKSITGYIQNEINSDIPYINGQGIYITPQDSDVYNGMSISVEWGGGEHTCVECGHVIDENDYYTHDDNIYCEDCFNDIFINCESCGNVIYRNDSTYIESQENYYCYRCINRYFTECSNCNEYFNNDEIIEQDCNCYCEDCFQSEFTQCQECCKYYTNDEITDGYCNGCYIEEEPVEQTSFLDALTAD